MPFDLNGFTQTVFVPRTAQVAVPELSAWFAPGEPPEWEVRCLTGDEIYRANDAVNRGAQMLAMVEAMAGASASDKTAALKDILGVGESPPDELARRIEHLVYASINPVIDRQAAIKLFTAFPVVASRIGNKII
jgi:hypothetical protein